MSHSKIWRMAPLAIILILFLTFWLSGLTDIVNFELIKYQRANLLTHVSNSPFLSMLIFMLVYTTSVALSLPIATVLTLLGGFLFGKWLGTFLIIISATSGAVIIFLAARSAVGESLRDKAGPLYNRIQSNMQKNAVAYLFFMRLVPLFPFFLVNIVPAMFNVRLTPYVLTTFFGIIPGTFVYVNLGRELASLNSVSDLLSPGTITAFTLLGVFALLPGLYRQVKYLQNNKLHGKQD